MNPMTATKSLPKLQPDPEDPAVVLTHGELAAIGTLLKKNLQDKDALLKAIQGAASVTVEGAVVILEPRLLQRLKSRCLDKGNFPNWLREVILNQLHDYAGW